MLKSTFFAAILIAAIQPLSYAQHILPRDANEARLTTQAADADADADADGSSLRHGLTGPVSDRAEQALLTGTRIPIIVMMRPAKEQDPDIRNFIEPRAGELPELSAIRGLRERVLLDAFGGNGIIREDLAGAPIAQRGGTGAIETESRPVLTRAFVATPGFTMLANAREISLLRATDGVIAVYEDRPDPLLLRDSTVIVGADDLWAQSIEGSGYSVAILDSGVENEHPMTGPAITASACFNTIVTDVSTSNCPGGLEEVTNLNGADAGDSCVEYVLDSTNGADGCYHGTHVASTAAGRTTSLGSSTISGVARGANIIAVNVFARFPASECGTGATEPCVMSWTSDQISALDWLYANRASLNLAAINMSLGGGKYSVACDSTDARTTVINNLRSAGIATVIASGNEGYKNAVTTPACISSAITVGATTGDDDVATFSNASSLVDLLAPGDDIFAAWQSEEPASGQSCIASGTPTAPESDGFCHWYTRSSGTSMATPHVAGAFALLRGAFPTASVTDIEAALEATGVSIRDTRNNQIFPRIQIDAAYARLNSGLTGPVNNDFADRITLSGASVSATGSNAGANKETGEPNHAQSGGASVWWSWTATSSSQVTITTIGSNYDTLLGVYTGSAVNSLTTVSTNDDVSTTTRQSRLRFFPTAGVTYHIAVDGYNGATGDISLSISQ